MVPIKLFVIFILGSAAIEPVVALPARGSKIRPPIPKDFQSAYNPVVAPPADTNHKPVQVVAPSALPALPARGSKKRPPIPKDFQSAYNPVVAPSADTNHKPVQVVAPSAEKESKSKPIAPPADTNHKPVQVVAPSAGKESKPVAPHADTVAPHADTNHKPVQVVAPSAEKESKPVAPPANEKPSKKAFIKGLFDRKPKPTIPLSPSPPSDYISKNFERVKGSLMDLGYTNVEEFPWHGKNNEE